LGGVGQFGFDLGLLGFMNWGIWILGGICVVVVEELVDLVGD
jgi:hypothetical protein